MRSVQEPFNVYDFQAHFMSIAELGSDLFDKDKSVLRTLHKVGRENNEKWNKLIVSFDTISFIILFLAESRFLLPSTIKGEKKNV